MSATRSAPVRHATSLSELLRDFRKRLGPEGPLEAGYMEWMRESPSLHVAVDRAVRSRKPDGKMHNHQSRVPLRVLLRYGMRLERRLRRARVRDFHALLVLCEECAVPGIGPVTQYDVAQRVGEFLGLLPDRVYLHAGVKDGAKKLGIDVRGKEWLMVDELPRPLRRLTPNEAEDFICVYRDIFPSIREEAYRRNRKSTSIKDGRR